MERFIREGQALILASTSPRRQELMNFLRLPFSVLVNPVDESFKPGVSPEIVAQTLACRKAEAVACEHPYSLVIGADTIVVYENRIFGKPKDPIEARQILRKLSGETHEVLTGVALVRGSKKMTFYEKTEVTFYALSDQEIEAYIQTGEPMDKAGAYGIQGYGATLVEQIQGDFYNVVGLPIGRLKRNLAIFGD